MSDTKRVDLEYPRSEGSPKFVQVGLIDVRAADDVRLHYDFDRNGWVVEQASIFSWSSDETKFDMDWKEVAFIKAWAREIKQPWDIE